MEKQYIVFLDSINRTILAQVVEDSEHQLLVKNPAVIQLTGTNAAKMSIQCVPFIFRELQADPTEDIIWTYDPKSITRASFTGFTPNFIKQYEYVVTLTPEKAAAELAKKSTEPVVKLFDDNK